MVRNNPLADFYYYMISIDAQSFSLKNPNGHDRTACFMHNDKKSVHTGKHRLLLKVVFGLGTFFLLFFLFDPQTILATLAGTRVTYLLWAFVCCLFVLLARAFRWMVILKDMGIHAMFWRIVEIYTISLWFNTFLPGSVGGDIYKVYGLVQDGSRTIQSLATVFIERFTGLMALITVAVLSVLFFSHMMPAPTWMLLSLIAIVAGGVISASLCHTIDATGLSFSANVHPLSQAVSYR